MILIGLSATVGSTCCQLVLSIEDRILEDYRRSSKLRTTIRYLFFFHLIEIYNSSWMSWLDFELL